jgi:hypothetical protein
MSMMQELKLYDPARKPCDWTDLIHPGQYAVFTQMSKQTLKRNLMGTSSAQVRTALVSP